MNGDTFGDAPFVVTLLEPIDVTQAEETEPTGILKFPYLVRQAVSLTRRLIAFDIYKRIRDCVRRSRRVYAKIAYEGGSRSRASGALELAIVNLRVIEV
jgi:hypothetical protein